MTVYWREYFLNYPFGIDGIHFRSQGRLPKSLHVGDVKQHAGGFAALSNVLSRLSSISAPDTHHGPVVRKQRAELTNTLLSEYFWDSNLDIITTLTEKLYESSGRVTSTSPYRWQQPPPSDYEIYPALEMIMGPLFHTKQIDNLATKKNNPVWDIGKTPYGPMFWWGETSPSVGNMDGRHRLYQSDIRTLSRLFNLWPGFVGGLNIPLDGAVGTDFGQLNTDWPDGDLISFQQWVGLDAWQSLEAEMPFLVVEWGSHAQSRGWEHKVDGVTYEDNWGPGDMRLWLILPSPESRFLMRCTAKDSQIQEWIASSHGPQGAELTPSGSMVNLDCLANQYPVFMLRFDANNKSGEPTTSKWEIKTLRNLINPETMREEDYSPHNHHPWYEKNRPHNRFYDNTYAIFSLQTNPDPDLALSGTFKGYIPWNPKGWDLVDLKKWQLLWEEAELNSNSNLVSGMGDSK